MLAPPEGLRAPGLPGVNPRSQGVIPRQFKRKKIFVTDEGRRTEDGWTDRRDGGNSYVDDNPYLEMRSHYLAKNPL